MRKVTVLILLLFLMIACNLPLNLPNLTTAPDATDTPTAGYEQCAFVWATRSLPELSAEIQSAMQAAGLKGITVNAEAFGENCVTANNEITSFGAMETDIRVFVEVSDLTDTAALGDLLEQILVVLDGFPSETMPGPQAGYIGISFDTGSETLNLWFTITDGESARALGLHGAALLDKLQNK